MTPDEANDKPSKRPSEWFDHEEIWRASYPFFFTNARFDQALVDINHALTLANPPGRAALDLCCGPGRFSIPLAERGFRVTAVDRTGYLIEKAQSRARSAGVDVEWVLEDMRDFIRPEAFDVALSMFTSFGYFEDKDDDIRVLRNVFRSLSPGGAFLIDVFGKEIIAARFLDTSRTRLDDGSLMFENRQVIDDWTRVHNEWTLVSDGQVQTFHFTVRAYSGGELRNAMEAAGFDDVALYGNLEGAPYDRRAARLIAVGRRTR
jgi:SAM-dependent methyltransferase